MVVRTPSPPELESPVQQLHPRELPVRSTPLDEAELPERYEVVHGEIQELPNMSYYSTILMNRLMRLLGSFLGQQPLGEWYAEVMIRLPLLEDTERIRRPDLAYFTLQRLAPDRQLDPEAVAIDILPNIVVEVLSPTDRAEATLAKVDEYFRAGVESVWVVAPLARLVYIYESARAARIIPHGEVLEFPSHFPGWSLNTRDLFPPVKESKPQPTVQPVAPPTPPVPPTE